MLEAVLYLDQHIERWNLPKVKWGIAVQHLVIESDVVESHNEVGTLQPLGAISATNPLSPWRTASVKPWPGYSPLPTKVIAPTGVDG